jgi:hypothetical protein
VRALGRPLRLLFLAAGLADAATGAALLAAPEWTLRRMGLAALPAEPVFVRWIGAFVLAVGAAYLLAFLPWHGAGARQRTVLEVTALQRGTVALFVAAAVAAGTLEPGWWPVAAFDGALALLQAGLLLTADGHGHREGPG